MGIHSAPMLRILPDLGNGGTLHIIPYLRFGSCSRHSLHYPTGVLTTRDVCHGTFT